MLSIQPFWRLALAVVTLVILFLSLIPAPPSEGLGWDKLNHAIAMAVVTVIAFRTLRPVSLRAVLLAGLYALLLGALIELLQGTLTTTRSAEWGDLLADAVGVALAMPGLYLWKRKTITREF
ncbi:hypothetical protein [Trichlorobacter lovleyi]|mgnify:FL=1|uniref:hypothetical protein n=1 Tax=Trichlorobacter lovleyi TaxID=313985 RepID=UPI0024802ADE|nr:hypothetical protein [Trichlorobacter lovleyi]